MSRYLLIVVFSGLCFSSVTYAQDYYFGGNFSYFDVSSSSLNSDFSLTNVSGKLGMYWGDVFSGEVRLGAGVSDDSNDVLGIEYELMGKEFLGGYIRARLPNVSGFYPYAIVGVSRVKLEVSSAGFSDSEVETDLSYGLGLDYDLGEGIYINLEIMSLYSGDGSKANAISVGYSRSF